MDGSTILLLLAVLFFVFEGFNVVLGAFSPKWWALGIACYLASQVPLFG